jgi:hypothetical protein
MNSYKLTHRAKCPNGALMDTYQITIRSHQTIMVEAILEALKQLPEAIFQEDIATTIRSKIGAEVVVVGWHHGVEITSTRL